MAGEKRIHVKRVFGSLINNATAIDGAKFSPWWIGLILFIFGILFPVVPLFVQSATTNGTSFMSSAEYGLGLDKTFGQAIDELNGLLTFDNANKTISYEPSTAYSADDNTLIGGYISTAGNCKDQYELRIYYSPISGQKEYNDFVSSKESIIYAKGTTTVATSDQEGYIPSSIYFFKDSFFVDLYASNSTEQKATMSFFSDLKCFNYDGTDLKKFFVGDSFNKDNKNNRVTALNNLKGFIDTTYETTKKDQMWLGSLLYIGIYTAVNVFMVLMIFLMSRGKNNPNNYLNFWHCIKIDWWASFCPGLLGLIFGFIFKGNATIIYVMLIAMRIMWLTTRELRPTYQ